MGGLKTAKEWLSSMVLHFRYIRDFTRATRYNPIKFSSDPQADIRDNSHADGPDIRCNQGAFSKAGNTQVLTVNAGDELKATLGVGATMQHPGPAVVYMSKAPNTAAAYNGSGGWFKIHSEGTCSTSDIRPMERWSAAGWPMSTRFLNDRCYPWTARVRS